MIYIQKAEGLQQVSPSLTKEKIIAALGYTPADNATFFEDESGALVIADDKGYVIARIDADGIETTQLSAKAIKLNDEDLAAKLEALGNVDLSNYYNKTEVDDKLKNVSVDLSGYAKTEDIPDHTKYDNHLSDEVAHVTAENKATWDAKSDFDGDFNSLSNAPHIVNDNEDEMVVCDSQGNVIFRATAEGINVAAIYVNGVQVNNELPEITADLEGAVLKIVDGKASWVLEA